MRTLMLIALFQFTLFQYIVGQTQDSTSHLNWQVQNGQVFMEWFLEKGQTCIGIGVSRRSDTLSDFQAIHFIEGLCGSNEKRTRYTYTDTNAIKNGLNYYKIDLGGASQMYTPGIFVLKNQEILIYPQPSHGQEVTIRFRNPQSQTYSFELYTLSGMKIMNLETQKEWIQLDNKFDRGIYIYRLVGDEQQVTGRLMF